MYVIVENLRRYLSLRKESPDEPAFLGAWVNWSGSKKRVLTGGPGYTLNQAAVKRFVEDLLPTCLVDSEAYEEDRLLSLCFHRIGLLAGDTRDEKTGAQQYHLVAPDLVYQFSWKAKGAHSLSSLNRYYESLPHPSKPNATVGPLKGIAAAGKYSVSFHYLEGLEALARFHAILHGSCPRDSRLSKLIAAVGFEALSENGDSGYVADPTLMKRKRLKYIRKHIKTSTASSLENDLFTALENYGRRYRNGTWSEATPLGPDFLCSEYGEGLDGGGTKMLKNKVQIANVTDSPRILCAIYTTAHNRDLARAAALTWGYKCDGFLAFSSETIPDLGIVNILHRGEESLENLWQKTRSIWGYIYEHYGSDYDYFHLGGDDDFVIVENLRRLVARAHEKFEQYPVLLGQSVLVEGRPGTRARQSINGEAGYTLSKAVLSRIVGQVLPVCYPFGIKGRADRILSQCLIKILIFPRDSRDEETGEQLYHRQNPTQLYDAKSDGNGPDSVLLRHYGRLPHPSKNGTVGIQTGLQAAGKYSVSFHFLRLPESLARTHAILYRSCPADSVIGQD
jgi:glycoprotein-N-acetylgalactosamine 3-beta-galactosyltransferase